MLLKFIMPMQMQINKSESKQLMKIIDIRHIDLGDDGMVINEFVFDTAISKSFINYLSQKSQAKFINSPIYKITFSDECIIRGVEGSNTARVYFNKNIKDNLSKVKLLIDEY